MCFLLQEVKEGKKGKKKDSPEVTSVGWVNLPLFNYEDVLHSGPYTMYMWNLTDEELLSEEQLNPIGTVEDNPEVSISLDNKKHTDKPSLTSSSHNS